MLTSIEGKILEIRPKQILESKTELINAWLVLVEGPKKIAIPKKVNEKSSKQPPKDQQTRP